MSSKSKSSNTETGNDPFFEASRDPELEKKVDKMMGIEEPTIKSDIPKSITVTHFDEPVAPVEPAAPVEAVEPQPAESVTEVSGAPILPINKTSAFKKKITVSDKNDTKVPLPADNELEPFEPPATEVGAIEEVALGDTEEVVVVPDPVEAARERISQLPPPSDELGLESASTSKAVDEIIAAEADELLVARDQRSDSRIEIVAPKPKTKKPKKPNKFKKIMLWLLLFLLVAGTAVAGAIPASRYALLNAAGVRVSSSVSVLDETTGQPLKNVEFAIAGNTSKTDAEGKATLSNLKLGKSTASVKKPAFAEQTQSVTLGWGSNPLGEFRLKAIGSQYTIVVTDFLSGKPIAKVEATSGESSALSDDAGKIVLALPQSDTSSADVQLGHTGYRKETVKIDRSNTKDINVSLVPARKQAFISKRAGTFDLYKIDVDGKNEQKILNGTGRERSETIALAIHPSKNMAALVSTREAATNSSESASTLTMVNLDDNSVVSVTQSSRIQLIDWLGDKLIFVKIGEGETEASTKRHRLVSYDITAKREQELASTNYFNDVITANGSIYYAPAAYMVNGSVGLYKINADGNYRKSIFDKEVWNLFRTDYDKLSVSIGEEWFDLNLASDVMAKGTAPTTPKSRTYINSPSSKTSLWTEERDGKGVLISHDIASKADTVLQTQSGIKNPIRWIDDTHIVYRVSSTSEIADYIMSTEGGKPQKIKDVTDTAGIDRWYYY